MLRRIPPPTYVSSLPKPGTDRAPLENYDQNYYYPHGGD